MFGFIQDLAREKYRFLESRDPSLWSKTDRRIADYLRNIQAIHFAELPTRLEVQRGPNLNEAIRRSLASKYSKISVEKLRNAEEWLYTETLKQRGYEKDSYRIALMSSTNLRTNSADERILIADDKQTLLFNRKHFNFTGSETIEGSAKQSDYYFGPSDIVVHDGKNTAFNFGSLPGYGITKISLNIPIAHYYRRPVKISESESPAATCNELYIYPVIARPAYIERLSQLHRKLVSMPLIVLAHELGHSNQTGYFQAELFPTNETRREANATYYAFRLMRQLREFGIDISNGVSNGELVSTLEQSLFVHGFLGEEERLWRRTGKSPKEVFEALK